MNEAEESCSNCRFHINRQCRRYPPRPGGIIPIQGVIDRQPRPAIMWGNPEPADDHWCGEWRPRLVA